MFRTLGFVNEGCPPTTPKNAKERLVTLRKAGASSPHSKRWRALMRRLKVHGLPLTGKARLKMMPS